MYIHSLIRSDLGFTPIQVEVVLLPGLSQIHIMGMADPVIKESSKRILSALRHQGFKIPAGKQVLVNLHPHSLRKKSQGLDLAIALGILLESQQIPKRFFDFERGVCYGALSLKGEVLAPSDLDLLNFDDKVEHLLTGPCGQANRFITSELKELRDWESLQVSPGDCTIGRAQTPPPPPNLHFPQSMARLIALCSHGGHSLLVAGGAGMGKTTLVEQIAHLRPNPEAGIFLETRRLWRLLGRELKWRPIIAPHHSITPMAMVGGGSQLVPGEISLAHGGALILDELLEFHPQIQSALREPMEKGLIYLSRAGRRQVLPAKSLILATTNLCPCGEFAPGKTERCRCSSLRLRQALERLTGPFLDRFALFHILEADLRNEATQSTRSIQERLQKAEAFQRARGQRQANSELDEASLQAMLAVPESRLPFARSQRRRLSLLRVARSLADLEGAERIQAVHTEEAQLWTARDAYRLHVFSADHFAARL